MLIEYKSNLVVPLDANIKKFLKSFTTYKDLYLETTLIKPLRIWGKVMAVTKFGLENISPNESYWISPPSLLINLKGAFIVGWPSLYVEVVNYVDIVGLSSVDLYWPIVDW